MLHKQKKLVLQKKFFSSFLEIFLLHHLLHHLLHLLHHPPKALLGTLRLAKQWLYKIKHK